MKLENSSRELHTPLGIENSQLIIKNLEVLYEKVQQDGILGTFTNATIKLAIIAKSNKKVRPIDL